MGSLGWAGLGMAELKGWVFLAGAGLSINQENMVNQLVQDGPGDCGTKVMFREQ